MSTKQNTETHTSGAITLSILAGWTAAPTGLDANDRWQIVAAALRSAGIDTPRPMPSTAQQLQQRVPVLLSTMEV